VKDALELVRGPEDEDQLSLEVDLEAFGERPRCCGGDGRNDHRVPRLDRVEVLLRVEPGEAALARVEFLGEQIR
jgi:hypothetical protein